MKKLITAIAICLALSTVLCACSDNAKSEEKTTAPQKQTTTVMVADDIVEPTISEKDANSTIENIYSAYDVINEKIVDNVIYYSIMNTDGKKYATVKVDLVTGDLFETLLSTNKTIVRSITEE